MSLAFLETFILSFIHHRHVPSLKVILHIQSHLYNQRLCHSLLPTIYVSSPIPDPPLLAYMFWKLPLSLIPSKISSMLHLQKLLHGHCHISFNTAERKSISGPSSYYPLHVIKTTILFIVVYIWGRKWDGCCQRCRGELSIMWLRNKERG